MPFIVPDNPILFEHTKLVLSCNVNSSSIPSYQWYYKNEIVSNNKTLSIDNVTVNQVGEYTCVNNLNKLMTSAKTNVLVECKNKI